MPRAPRPRLAQPPLELHASVMQAWPDDGPSLRAYLSTVYPLANASIGSMDTAALRALFESLDYYYACHGDCCCNDSDYYDYNT